MNTVLLLIAAPLFLLSLAAHIYVKLRLSPKDEDLDDYYYEFEDRHPGLAKYTKWSNITLAAAVISMLLLLLAVIL
jgi:hypothetical protein